MNSSLLLGPDLPKKKVKLIDDLNVTSTDHFSVDARGSRAQPPASSLVSCEVLEVNFGSILCDGGDDEKLEEVD